MENMKSFLVEILIVVLIISGLFAIGCGIAAHERNVARHDAQRFSGHYEIRSSRIYFFQARLEIETDQGVISLPTGHPDSTPFVMAAFGFRSSVPTSIEVIPQDYTQKPDQADLHVDAWQNGAYMRIVSFDN